MRTKQLQCFLTAVLVLLLFSFGAQGKGRPFITRWKGEAGKELYIPIKGENYKLVIKKADGTVLKTETSLTLRDKETYKFTPFKDGELLIEAGLEGVRSFFVGMVQVQKRFCASSNLVLYNGKRCSMPFMVVKTCNLPQG